ncbi:response regulator transcription factor [Paenibacillus alvei]|uniref:response regulator transcription factor n=1 Tax=Paenibacillus TaxID=44249 RepID=UPI000287B64A|nr:MULTISPECIES: response regulator transcription factor [Paenibacillus]EJW15122.1 alkaline phosphatase synthesis transcriptional regulatory protein PhoP [Paenibacillus alvei DSM 29]MCY9543932.1 response regulator transcription factor [Paenibacillus alvei]MCY9705953.1 response regulator transcription factor [Paenibacillus alvei]MCY9737733.1 response regulator transcription factor [Paenibacillus alvei]MCY9754725.1 response regulator transcription factor [Paenibacillus alvei]
MIKVLVVDDESSIQAALVYALSREGYEVETAADGQEALEKVETFSPEVMVLDVMMPRVSGYDVCRKLDGQPRPAILLLTVKNDIVDKVLGLELGADDYMTKPFDMRELLARVKALSRRGGYVQQMQQEQQQDVLRLGDLTAEMFSRTVSIEGELLDLTPKEFDLLVLLMRNPGRVYSREMLLEKVWDMDFAGGTRTVDIHVQRLRKKLGTHHGLIQTVYGIGYKSTGHPR